MPWERRRHRIVAKGDIDYRDRPDMLDDAMACLKEHGRVVFDLTGVEMMDSSGVGVLVGAMVFARSRRIDPSNVVLAGAPPRVERVLHITGLDRIFLNREDPDACAP